MTSDIKTSKEQHGLLSGCQIFMAVQKTSVSVVVTAEEAVKLEQISQNKRYVS